MQNNWRKYKLTLTYNGTTEEVFVEVDKALPERMDLKELTLNLAGLHWAVTNAN